MGGSSQTTTVTPAPISAEDRAFKEGSLKVQQQQLEALISQQAFQEKQFGLVEPLLQLQVEDAQTARERALELQPIEDELIQRQLEIIRSGGAATPEQQAAIEGVRQSSLESGERDINRFQEEATGRLRSELAPSLGLRPTDSPILDRGALIGQEAVRQQGDLASNLATASANAELNFPLAANQVQGALSISQQQLASSANQFQQQLVQQAFLNRQRVVGDTGNQGLGLASIGSGGFPGLGTGGQISNSSSKSGGGLGSILSGGGSLLSGASAAGLFSSKALKDNFVAIDDDAILEEFADMDIAKWTYKGEERQHIGPFAEDFQQKFDVGDGVTINFIDAIGVLASAVKALSRKAQVA